MNTDEDKYEYLINQLIVLKDAHAKLRRSYEMALDQRGKATAAKVIAEIRIEDLEKENKELHKQISGLEGWTKQ